MLYPTRSHSLPGGTARRSLAAWGAVLAAAAAPIVHAHEGHGLAGAHWHASDVWGFVGLALAVGAALWLGRK